jgi:hypothetical protein
MTTSDTSPLSFVAPELVVCQIALSMLASKPRKTWRAVPYPTEDQALAVACKFLDLGLDCDDHHVMLAVALLKSRATIQWIESYR